MDVAVVRLFGGPAEAHREMLRRRDQDAALEVRPSEHLMAFRGLVPWAVAGFAINLVTGVMFLVATPEQYIRNLSWWFKVLFLVIAGVNVLLFETTQRSRMLAMGPGEDTPAAFKVIGGVSLASWFMALYWGRMLPFLGNAF